MMYNLAISFHKYLYKDIFTNTYIFANTLESSLTFMCSGFQWDTGWLQIHRDSAGATPPVQKEAGIG